MPRPSVLNLPIEDFQQVGRDLGLSGACQLGFVAEDLEKAARVLGPRLGVKVWYLPRVTRQKLFYKNLPIASKLKIAVGYAGRNQVELVQWDAQRNSLFEVVPADPENTPHHLGFFVRNVDAHCSHLANRGMQPVQTGSIWFAKRHRTRVAYFDARNSLGHTVELIEHRVQGLCIGIPHWYLMLGALTGQIERLRL